MNRGEIIYAIYKGDKFIDLGTKNELALKMNVKPQTILFFATPTNWKRYEEALLERRDHIVAIKIGKIGDELDEGSYTTKATKSK